MYIAKTKALIRGAVTIFNELIVPLFSYMQKKTKQKGFLMTRLILSCS